MSGRERRPVTSYAVAARAGESIAAVSRALRDSDLRRSVPILATNGRAQAEAAVLELAGRDRRPAARRARQRLDDEHTDPRTPRGAATRLVIRAGCRPHSDGASAVWTDEQRRPREERARAEQRRREDGG